MADDSKKASIRSSPKIYSADDLLAKLAIKYAAPEWALLPQVREATGLSACRTADAIAMSLWPSRGLYLHGFEIKVNRGDWLNELKNPEKADVIASFCEFWWIVAVEGVVAKGELPIDWGLLTPRGSGLHIEKQATLKTAKNPDKLFLAAILRRAQQIFTPQAKFDAQYERGLKDGIKQGLSKGKWRDDDIDRLQERLKRFEQQSGIRIDEWSNKNIGEAVKLVLNGSELRIRRNLNGLLLNARNIVKEIEIELESTVSQ